MKKRICTICARGGSKGVKSKNLRPLLGKPLVQHSIEHALAVGIFDEVAVSSDSDAILDAAKRAGVRWMIRRPPEMATDTAEKEPAIVHCASEVERLSGTAFDTFVDLDASAPLRSLDDIRGAVDLLESGDISNVFSVVPARRNPYFNMVEVGVDGVPVLCKSMSPVPFRRQDSPPVYDLNASIYAWRREEFFKLRAAVFAPKSRVFVMPDFTAWDLDTEFDFRTIEAVYPHLAELRQKSR